MVEDKENLLIFDPIVLLKGLDVEKNIYIFSTHSHGDHFKPEVFEYLYEMKNAYFIFSKDIAPKIEGKKIKNLVLLDHYENTEIHDVKISAYGTTDLGNSYLVTLKGQNYFHSGDLNWWHWVNRMTSDQLANEESDFKREVDLLKGKDIDFAFVPVDPRLEEQAYLAINYFIETLHPGYVIPMHSFGEYSFYKDLEEHIELHNTKLLNVHRENEIVYEK